MKGGTQLIPGGKVRPAPQGGAVVPVAPQPGIPGPGYAALPPRPPAPGSVGMRPPHPLMAPMYWSCAELLSLAPQLAGAALSLPAPDLLRERIQGMLAAMSARARQEGIPPEDVHEAQYALVALLDEVLLRSTWPLRSEWNVRPLQFLLYNENTAGEGFFLRLRALEEQPHRVHVLQVYFFCLAQGFQGRYAVSGSGEGLFAILERVGAIVGSATPPADPISPHGETADLGKSLFRQEAPLVRLGIALAVLGIGAFVVLRVWLTGSVASAVQPMHDYAAATASTAPSPASNATP